ncbi:MAG: epoxyqueuosine reductase [Acidimicrobiia bacterium]
MDHGLTAELASLATEHGAAGFGVTGVEPFAREREALHTRIESGLAGPLRFTYDDPDLSTDVIGSFPWARSLVVVSWDYLPAARSPAKEGAVVGRFATSDHYQGVSTVTDAVAGHLRGLGHRAEILSDDNRLVDRAAAVRAGLGWSGKSTMVLAPGHGPWMLLGSVVTDVALIPGEPMRRDCGTCVACIPACPTGALGDWGLDARRCLSTWLQTAGSIPQWIRPLLGRRVYGCDDCLTACPPGKRALAGADRDPMNLPFAELLALSDADLIERFNWWYVPRRQGRFIRRNLLVAAGNSAESGAREEIERHLRHPSSMIRGHAYWAMARGFSAGKSLRAALENETVPEAHEELVLALLMVEHPEAHAEMLAADEWARTHPVRGLALVGPHASAEGSASDDLRLLYLDSHIDDGDLEEPMVRIYDPDRTLERLSRDSRLRASAPN